MAGRIHRLGQTRGVLIKRLCYKESIDMAIDQLHADVQAGKYRFVDDKMPAAAVATLVTSDSEWTATVRELQEMYKVTWRGAFVCVCTVVCSPVAVESRSECNGCDVARRGIRSSCPSKFIMLRNLLCLSRVLSHSHAWPNGAANSTVSRHIFLHNGSLATGPTLIVRVCCVLKAASRQRARPLAAAMATSRSSCEPRPTSSTATGSRSRAAGTTSRRRGCVRSGPTSPPA